MRIIMVLIFLAIWQGLNAQSAGDYFHSAALQYIDSKTEAALRDIHSGLQLDPSHEKLLALLDKIKEEKEEEQQKKSGQDQQSQDDKEQQDNQKDQQQQKQDQEQKSQSEEQQNESGQDEQQPEDEKQEENQAGSGEEEETQPPAQQSGENEDLDQISREAALQILKALENEEKNSKIKQRPVRSTGEKRENDW